MNGHLQLSISLKDHDEMKNAIVLLVSLLPPDQQLKIPNLKASFIEQPRAVAAPITRGDLVKLESPSNYGEKGMKELMADSQKSTTDQIIADLRRATFNPPKLKLTTEDKKKLNELKTIRDKYAYNQYGRFLRKKKPAGKVSK